MWIGFFWLLGLVNTVMIFKAILRTFAAGGNTTPSEPYLIRSLGVGEGACGVSPLLRLNASPYWA